MKETNENTMQKVTDVIPQMMVILSILVAFYVLYMISIEEVAEL